MSLYLPWDYQSIQNMIFALIRFGGYSSEKELLQMPIHDVKCRIDQLNELKKEISKK